MPVATSNRSTLARRPHVHELDRLRVETALSVVVVHVLMFTMFVEHSTLGLQVQTIWVAIFHFTRELFVFVTGFALVYVYFGKPFKWRYFWRRRGIGVLFPYVLWSLIYTVVNNPGLTWQALAGTSAFEIVTGGASYQLYYILMTLQFYLLLPAFLWFLGRVRRHPWIVLGISFALQAAFQFWDYAVISGPNTARTPLILTTYTYQERFVLAYQFYFILGGMAALYHNELRAFLAKRGQWLLAAGILAFAANLAYSLLAIYVWRIGLNYVVTAIQPILAVYCTGLILGLTYLAYRSVLRSPAGLDPRKPRNRWWALLSDASFGIFLVHALVLTVGQRWLVPVMSGASPWIILPVLSIVTMGASILITVVLLQIPALSRTVGRETTVALRRQAQANAQAA